MRFLQDFKEDAKNEGNEEATTLDDLSNNDAALFKEETQNTEDNNYLGLCTENIPSTVLHTIDEQFSNELDCVDYTNSKKDNSLKTSELFKTPVPSSKFQIIIAGNSVSEYITSDPIGPDPKSSPLVETKSTDTKLDLPPIEQLVGFSSDISNDANGLAGLQEKSFSKSNIKFPNCPQPTKTSRVENEFISGVSKRKRPLSVAHLEAEASLNSVYNKDGRSRSSLVDSDDSGSDWEQEYLASKDVCSKSRTVIKRPTQAKQDHKVSKKYPS